MSERKAWVSRILGDSRYHSGNMFTPDNKVKLDTLSNSIHSLLCNQSMALGDLVGHLMSEPCELEVADLHLVAIALNNLSEAGLLKVTFEVQPRTLSVEAKFRANIRKHNTSYLSV